MKFADYEILGEIARGAQGVVYRARRGAEPDVVALKVLLDEADPGEATARRFEREVKTGLALDHPGIVKVFDAGCEKGRLYFSMELVSGTSLDKVLPTL